MIYELLQHGADNAITTAALAELLNANSRQITLQVRAERMQGKPICSNQNGFYIAASRQEMEEFCGRLLHRGGEMFKMRNALINELDKLPDPEALG